MTTCFRRIFAITYRQLCVIKHSPPRWLTYTFWPTFSMVIWGFFNKFLVQDIALQQFTFSTLLGAALISNFFERSNVNIMFSFLEDVWSRNIGNLLISPIHPLELITGYIVNGMMAMIIGMSFATVLAWFIFGYNVLEFGLFLLPIIVNLVLSGWCIGLLLIAIILRFGPSGESVGWMMAMALSPFIAIFYPVSVLPEAVQHFSWALPPTYMFENMRELIHTRHFNWDYFRTALLLNVGYLVLCIGIFLYQLKKARYRGGLFSMSE